MSQFLAMGLFCTRKKCNKMELKKRKTSPWTATKDGHLYFDYWQCPKCKANYAFDKEVTPC